MINHNLDMSSEKIKIINELIESYHLMHLYYLKNIDNNIKIDEK